MSKFDTNYIPTKDTSITVYETDLTEIELRVLAHMREDAEKMDPTDSFRRPTDLQGYDTGKVRTLLTLKEAQSILKTEEGCLDPTAIRKSKAAELFGCEVAEVTKEQIKFAKMYQFAEMYGGDPDHIKKMVAAAILRADNALQES